MWNVTQDLYSYISLTFLQSWNQLVDKGLHCLIWSEIYIFSNI